MFVPELLNTCISFSQKGEIYSVHTFFLELMKKELPSLFNEVLEELSNDGEYYISILIKNMAFVTQCFISSNKKIHIQKIRFQKGIYKHELRVLYGSEYAEDDTLGNRMDLLDSYSVYLVKDQLFLNLTPFLIDKNSILDIVTPDLVQYYFLDKDNYLYDHITENSLNSNYEISQAYMDSFSEEEIVSMELVNELKKLMELFRRNIGGLE